MSADANANAAISPMDEIEPGLWIGDATAARDVANLKRLHIGHVLTLDSCPLPTHILQQPGIQNKYIQVSDVAKEDLLTHFDECIQFIERALQQEHNVLVHCYFGTSRSVTVVLAFLMRSHRITFTPALERVKAKRPTAAPNSGFVQQLRLFGKMGWRIDGQHELFKVFRLRQAADKVRKAKILPQTCMDLVKPDPALVQANPEPHVYRCRKCRRVVAAKSNIITHQRPSTTTITNSPPQIQRPTASTRIAEAQATNDQADIVQLLDDIELGTNVAQLSISDQSSSSDVVEPLTRHRKPQTVDNIGTVAETDATATAAEVRRPCGDIIFVEPIAWMDGVMRETQGKLRCPKCQTKLGSFSWTMGCNCPCGTQVSPAFYLVAGRVELSRSVQNVEMSV